MRILSGYQKPVTALAVSPDGARLFSAAEGQTMIWQWNLATGEVEKKLRGLHSYHSNAVMALACSADGKWLLSAAEYHGLAVWSLPEGEGKALHVNQRQDTNDRPGVAIHPAGRLGAASWHGYASSRSHGVQVWDLHSAKRKLLIQEYDKLVNAVAFSPNGGLLAVGSSDKMARLFDVNTGEETLSLKQKGVVSRLAFRPDGKLLAVSCAKAVFVWDLQARKLVHTVKAHAASITALAYSPDGKHLATAAPDGVVCLYDAATHEPRGQRHLDVGALGPMAWLPDSSGVAAGGEKPIVIVELSELLGTEHAKGRARGEPLSLPGKEHRVTGLAYSPDGRALCGWGRDGVRMWDLSRGAGQAKEKEKFKVKDDPAAVSWSADGTRLALSDYGSLTIHDAQTGKQVRHVKFKGEVAQYSRFTPAGDLFLVRTGGPHGERWFALEIRDPEGKRALFSRHVGTNQQPAYVTQAAIPATGRNVYLVAQQAGTYRWTPQADELVRLFGQDTEVTHLMVTDDERLAVTTGGNSAFVWSLPDGQKKLTLKHPLLCSGAAFLSGGRLATSCYDGVVRVWDASGGSELLTLDLGMGKIYSFAVSPDHMTFAAGVEKDRRIVLMDVPE